MRLLASFVAASLLSGCWTPNNPHCDPDYCSGTTLHTCAIEGNDAGRVAAWTSTPCSGACVNNKGVFCALSKTPIPECATDGDICYQGAAATCRAGYLATSMSCSVACAVPQGTAFCALTSGPVAECTQDGPACYQGNIGTCRAGYVVSSGACSSGTTCANAGSCGPTCALATTPDASCPAPGADQKSSYCAGNTQVSCQCGYALARVDCGTGSCIAIGGEAMCALASTTDPRCKPPASAFCDNNTLYQCWNGYAVSPQPCGIGTCMFETTGGIACYYKSG